MFCRNLSILGQGYKLEHHNGVVKGAPLGKALVLIGDLRLGCRHLTVTNTLVLMLVLMSGFNLKRKRVYRDNHGEAF